MVGGLLSGIGTGGRPRGGWRIRERARGSISGELEVIGPAKNAVKAKSRKLANFAWSAYRIFWACWNQVGSVSCIMRVLRSWIASTGWMYSEL